MSLKDRAMERVLGGVTGKAVKGLVPLLESIHTYMELQAALLEEILRLKWQEVSNDEEEINEKIDKIKRKIVETPEKSDPNNSSIP